jgi:hypothetical protein
MRVYFYDNLQPSSVLNQELSLKRLSDFKSKSSPFYNLQHFCLRHGLKMQIESTEHAAVQDKQYIWLNLLKYDFTDPLTEYYRYFSEQKVNVEVYDSAGPVAIFYNETYGQERKNFLIATQKDINIYMLADIIKKFHTQTRSFNRLYFLSDKVSKVVNWSKKGESEFFFYKNIPISISHFFPKIYKSLHTEYEFIYEMELIKAFDLSVYYIHGQLNLEIFENFLIQVQDFLHKTDKKPVSRAEYSKKLDFYVIEKCRKRIDELLYLRPEYRNKKIVTSLGDLSVPEIFLRIESEFKQILPQVKESELLLSHGDLTFGNILWPQDKKIKLVDPRGGGSTEELYFPVYYDLAKISQCINGNYDGILNQVAPDSSSQSERFTEWLRELEVSVQLVQITEASLFLSLLPLHLDNEVCFESFIQAAARALARGKNEY